MEPTTSSQVSRITVARLFNTGNYEHVRYEISVDLSAGADPGKALTELEETIESLNPGRYSETLEVMEARRKLAKPVSELPEWEIGNIPIYKKRVEEAEATQERKRLARERLSTMGGQTKRGGGRDDFGRDDQPED